jgi:peptidoglycan/LPS O-acetylase OafA/YrhL
LNYLTLEWAGVQIILFVGGFAIAIAMAIPCQRLFRIDITPSGRDAHLDGLRALAALAVVTGHANQYLLAFFGYTQLPEAGNQFGVLGVKLFFALTAYLFTARALDGKLEPVTFLIGRFRRIMPLYFVAATVAIVFSWLYFVEPMPPIREWSIEVFRLYTYGFFPYQTLTLKGHSALGLIGIAWTLTYEWRFYLFLVPATLIVRTSRAVALALVVAAILLAAFEFHQNAGVLWPFFIVGSLAAIMEPYARHVPPVARHLLALIAPVFAFLAIQQDGSGFAETDALLAAGLFLAILFGKPRILEWAPLQLLGRVSYSIYLLQYLVLFRVVLAGFGWGVATASPIWKYAAAWAVVAFLVPISCASYKWIEFPLMSKRTAPEGAPNLVTAPATLQ